MNKEFTDESIGKGKDEVAMRIEPKMLPARFRERSHISQRMYILIFVMLYSAAIGVITFTLLNGLAEKMQGVYKGNKNILIISMVMTMVALFTGAATPIWSRDRKLLFSLFEFVLIILSPIIVIAGFIFLQTNFSYTFKEPKKLLFMVGLITLASNAVPIVITIGKTIINKKRYRNSMFKAFSIAPGNLIFAATTLVMWMMIKVENGSLNLSSSVMMASAGAMVGGLLIMIVGIIISLKWDIKGSKSIWTSVRVIGALPVLIVYTMLLVIGVRFMELKFSKPVLYTTVIDGILILLMGLYVFFRGGIKNLIKTNPIYNNVFLRLFVILAAITGLVMVTLMDKLIQVKDFGPPSFTILAITSFTVLVGVVIAHFGKIITYTKFLKAMIIGALITLLLVILIVMSIIILKRSEIILAIISRQLISVFLIFSIVTEMIALAMDITVTVYKIVVNSRKREKKAKVKANSQNDVKGVK